MPELPGQQSADDNEPSHEEASSREINPIGYDKEKGGYFVSNVDGTKEYLGQEGPGVGGIPFPPGSNETGIDQSSTLPVENLDSFMKKRQSYLLDKVKALSIQQEQGRTVTAKEVIGLFREINDLAGTPFAIDTQNELEKILPSFLSDCLQSGIDESIDPESPFNEQMDAAKEVLRYLYQIMELQTIDACSQVCQDAVQEVEKILLQSSPVEIRKYLQQKLEFAEQSFKGDEKDFRECLRVSTLLDPELERASEHFFKEVDGQLVYEYKDGQSGEVNHWVPSLIELPMGASNRYLFCFRCLEYKEMMIATQVDEIGALINQNVLDTLAQKAIERSQTEKQSREMLREYDLLQGLPENAKVVLIRIFPKKFDKSISLDLPPALLLSGAIKAKYGEKAITRPVVFTDDLLETLQQELSISEQDVQDPVCYCIHIYGHGTKEYISFGEKKAKGTDVAKLALQHYKPGGKHLSLNALACFQGGLIKGIKQATEKLELELNGLSIFTMTQGDVPNWSAGNSSVPYYYNLIKSLYEMKTMGQAIEDSDIEVKKIAPNDAVQYINGTEISLLYSNVSIDGHTNLLS